MNPQDARDIVDGIRSGDVDSYDLLAIVEDAPVWIYDSTSGTAERIRRRLWPELFPGFTFYMTGIVQCNRCGDRLLNQSDTTTCEECGELVDVDDPNRGDVCPDHFGWWEL